MPMRDNVSIREYQARGGTVEIEVIPFDGSADCARDYRAAKVDLCSWADSWVSFGDKCGVVGSFLECFCRVDAILPIPERGRGTSVVASGCGVGEKLGYDPVDVVESLEIERRGSGGSPFNLERSCR